MTSWTKADIPDMTGKRVLITGATSGLGKAEAQVLAERGADLILGVRNIAKGETVADTIRRASPDASVEVRRLDLASLASIESFATALRADHERIDVLINNAGVMVPPYGRTEDGFELQMGTNHFGAFALTGRLLPLLAATPGSRVTLTSSVAHKQGKPDLADLDSGALANDSSSDQT